MVIKAGSDLQMERSEPPGVRAGLGLASVVRPGVLGSGVARPFGVSRLPGVLGTVSSAGGELLVLVAVPPRVVGVAGGAIGVFCGTGCDGEGVLAGDDMVMWLITVISAGSCGLTSLRVED